MSASGTVVRAAAYERVVWPVVLGVAIVLSTFWIGGFYFSEDAGNLFLDAHIYFRATDAWVDGGNAWTVDYRGVPFGGWPPTLLLNLPLVPLGESPAVAFWVAANTLSIVYLIRRLNLPIWTALLQPVVEGWLSASPDLALAGLMVAGGGWLAAVAKPYSGPMLIAHRRWRQVAVAGVVLAVTVPALPWYTFIESRDLIARAFADFAGRPVSAAGNPALMVAVGVALVSVGWRRGFTLLTPGLIAQQPHYMVFALESVRWSRVLALAMTVPLPHSAAVGVIAYAVLVQVRRLNRTRGQSTLVAAHPPSGLDGGPVGPSGR